MPKDETVVSLAEIEQRILTIRGQKVMLDSDLARLYGVPTKRLNEQVRRNLERFPPDFMFQLSVEEASALRSQFATSKLGRGGRRYLPYAFTEHGAIMLANVLNTPRAAEVSVYVVRAFVRLRQLAGTNVAMAEKLAELERRVMGHDDAIRSLVRTIRQLMEPPDKTRRSIGFRVEEAAAACGKRRRLRRESSRRSGPAGQALMGRGEAGMVSHASLFSGRHSGQAGTSRARAGIQEVDRCVHGTR